MKKIFIIMFALLSTIIYAQSSQFEQFGSHIQTQIEIYEQMSENLHSRFTDQTQRNQWVRYRNQLTSLRSQLNRQEIVVNNAIRDNNPARIERELAKFDELMSQLKQLQSDYNNWLRALN